MDGIKRTMTGVDLHLEHPHSQIVGTPVIPPQIRYRIEDAQKYHEDTGEGR